MIARNRGHIDCTWIIGNSDGNQVLYMLAAFSRLLVAVDDPGQVA